MITLRLVRCNIASREPQVVAEAVVLVGPAMQGMAVEPQTLLDVSGAVPESVTSSVLDACHNRGFSGIQEAITDAIASGWGVITVANNAPCILSLWQAP